MQNSAAFFCFISFWNHHFVTLFTSVFHCCIVWVIVVHMRLIHMYARQCLHCIALIFVLSSLAYTCTLLCALMSMLSFDLVVSAIQLQFVLVSVCVVPYPWCPHPPPIFVAVPLLCVLDADLLQSLLFWFVLWHHFIGALTFIWVVSSCYTLHICVTTLCWCTWACIPDHATVCIFDLCGLCGRNVFIVHICLLWPPSSWHWYLNLRWFWFVDFMGTSSL